MKIRAVVIAPRRYAWLRKPNFISTPRRCFEEDDARIQRITKSVINKMIAMALSLG